MKKNTLLIIFSLIFSIAFGQKKQWNLVSEKGTKFAKKDLQFRKSNPNKYKIYSLDLKNFEKEVSDLAKGSTKMVLLPTYEGLQRFSIEEASSLAPELAARFPMIKSYAAKGIDDPSATSRLSIGTDGLHAVIYVAGEKTFYIDPYTKDNQNYIAYSRADLPQKINSFSCEVEDTVKNKAVEQKFSKRNADDGKLRTFRLAMTCTGEYAQYHLTQQGVPASTSDFGKKIAVLSAMNTTVTRVNAVYERDLGVRMVLVANNQKIIFLDPATDGLSNGDTGSLYDENQPICDSQIGAANYDIGHLVSLEPGTGSGDGVAGLGVVCISGQKAKGVTSKPDPIGDAYDIDFVAHEMGHQFGANHTQNNNCNRNSATAVEPGSASTIMGYAGICSPNVQDNSDDHFHSVNIDEMWNNIQGSGSCASITNTGNNAPTANAGNDYSIPKSTPFVLKGAGSDVDDGNILTYNWEQTDNETATMPPLSTNTVGPAFRSNSSVTSPNRYMPALATVIAGSTSSTWEVVPSVARELNFSLVVRDNNAGGGNSARDNMVITVTDAEPFLISSQNVATSWDTGSIQTITWDVGTTNAAPINCQTVNIKLSTDGGITFNTILASNIPNNGSYTFTVPDSPTTTARIIVEAADNIFYDVNDTNFTINSTTPTFIITNTSGDQEGCNFGDETASFDLNFDFVNGFSEDVSLVAINQPTGSSINFNPATINSDGNVILEISKLDGVTAQDYTITITGTSASVTQMIDVTLRVFSNSFSTVILTSPADTETNIDLTPIFTWEEETNSSLYDIEIALDNTFTDIVHAGTSSVSSYQLPIALQGETTYFWRVKPKNSCAEGNFSSVYSFTTEACVICGSNGNTTFETSTTLVKFNTINNPSAKPMGYGDYTANTTTVKRDETHDLTVNVNTDDSDSTQYTVKTLVWIDWNQDCDFDDEGEEYDLGLTTGTADGPTEGSPLAITIPSDAALGNTTMRVSTKYANDGSPTFCEIDFDGEVEDYTIIIEDNPAAVEDIAFEGFNLYPNPSKGEFTLNLEVFNTDKLTVQLFDIRGRLVGEKNYFNTKNSFSERVSFGKTSAGLYLVKITNGNKQTTRKLLIE